MPALIGLLCDMKNEVLDASPGNFFLLLFEITPFLRIREYMFHFIILGISYFLHAWLNLL